MFSLDITEFGKPIRFDNTPIEGQNMIGANAMVSQFLNVKRNYNKDLHELTGSDNHAFRYFCYDDCAFIFNIKAIQLLLDAIKKWPDGNEKDNKGCIVVFQGLKKEYVSSKDPDNSGCAFGRPTAIAAAYVQLENGDLHHVRVNDPYYPIVINDDDPPPPPPPYDGFEHPGNGNSGVPNPGGGDIKSRQAAAEKSPIVVEKCKDYRDVDFSIKTILPASDLAKWQEG